MSLCVAGIVRIFRAGGLVRGKQFFKLVCLPYHYDRSRDRFGNGGQQCRSGNFDYNNHGLGDGQNRQTSPVYGVWVPAMGYFGSRFCALFNSEHANAVQSGPCRSRYRRCGRNGSGGLYNDVFRLYRERRGVQRLGYRHDGFDEPRKDGSIPKYPGVGGLCRSVPAF